MTPRLYAQRPAAPRCRGGASSLLRLSSAAAGRWPSPTALNEWVGRVSQHGLLAPEPEPMQADSPTQLFKRLWPSAV